MKRFGNKTPNEVFIKKLNNLTIVALISKSHLCKNFI